MTGPFRPLLPKLPAEHVVLHPDARNERSGEPREVEHPHRGSERAHGGAQCAARLCPRAGAEQREREAEHDGHDRGVARVAHDRVRPVRYEAVSVLQRELEGEMPAQRTVACGAPCAAKCDEGDAKDECRGERRMERGGEAEDVAEKWGKVRCGGEREARFADGEGPEDALGCG